VGEIRAIPKNIYVKNSRGRGGGGDKAPVGNVQSACKSLCELYGMLIYVRLTCGILGFPLPSFSNCYWGRAIILTVGYCLLQSWIQL
jgi:hypothetical protein